MSTTTKPRVLIVSDAWQPQNNAIVENLGKTIAGLEQNGYTVDLIVPEPKRGLTVPAPFHPEYRLELFGGRRIDRALKAKPDYVHIVTEGTLGAAARRLCLDQDRRFTTAYYVQYPEYIAAQIDKIGLLHGWGGKMAERTAYRALRRFHNASSAMIVPTAELENLLRQNNVAPDRLIAATPGSPEFIAALQAAKPPLQAKFLHRLIFDYLIGWPLALVQRIPGVSLVQWCGKYLVYSALNLRERRLDKPRLDDF